MITKKDISLIPKSFDVVGDILIFLDFPESLTKKEKEIGKYLLSKLKNINVICKKTKKFSGTFRLSKLKIIAGERRKETLHKENNCLFKLNVETCYFSTRLGNERQRIYEQIKKGERVLVMFSGIGIYPIEISKKSKAKEVFGIEINPNAHEYALENLKINKVSNVKLYNGDVRKIVPKITGKFDRILMPLPKDAYKFLDLALSKIKNNGIIHMYDFLEENEFKIKGKERMNNFNVKYKLIRSVKCGQISPRKYRVCFDYKIL